MTMIRVRTLSIPTAAIVLALTLTACSGGAGGTASTATGPVGATVSAAPTAAESVGVGASPATTAVKVSANTASETEIASALEAAGVLNATRWAREVTEYRPYPLDDPTLQHLQDNLAKYNPDPATLAEILSALKP
jgi:hypothetical protein